MRLFTPKKRTAIVETIYKNSTNKKELNRRLKKLFRSQVHNRELLWLLNDNDFLNELVVRFYEQHYCKGMYTVNKTWVHSELVNEMRRRNTYKRKATFVQFEEETTMFEQELSPIEQLEQYDYITKTYGENYAKYLVSGEYDLKDLQEAEGISRATLFRKLKKMRGNK